MSYATGGTVTNISNSDGTIDRLHRFTSSGTFTVLEEGEFEVLIAGGGGGGGPNEGGGGGAGGIAYHPSLFLNENNYPVIVGAGGGGSQTSGTKGNNGGNSSAFGILTYGGGGGGAHSTNQGDGRSGGCGGGGASNCNNACASSGGSAIVGTGPAGTIFYGNRGGNANLGPSNDPYNDNGSGGGGASEVGVSNPGCFPCGPGRGGNGMYFEIIGREIAGGGGGGGVAPRPQSAGNGGSGGGGAGGRSHNDQRIDGTSGENGTGSGGGAGGRGGDSKGGSGGSGLVAIKYFAGYSVSSYKHGQGNGTITPSELAITPGGDAQLTITPDANSFIEKILVNNKEISLTTTQEQDGYTLDILNIHSAQRVDVTFSPTPIITTSTRGNGTGTITPNQVKTRRDILSYDFNLMAVRDFVFNTQTGTMNHIHAYEIDNIGQNVTNNYDLDITVDNNYQNRHISAEFNLDSFLHTTKQNYSQITPRGYVYDEEGTIVPIDITITTCNKLIGVVTITDGLTTQTFTVNDTQWHYDYFMPDPLIEQYVELSYTVVEYVP